MDIVFVIVALLIVVGLGLVLFERRRGRAFKIEDTTYDISTHASREEARIADEIRNRWTFRGENH